MKKTSNATEIHQCCIQAESCPNLKRRKRATVIDFDSELQRNFANRLCPVGWQACRYDQNQVDADPSIEDTCISLTELNEFAECQQGCEETFPTDDPDYFEYDLIDQIDISALGERSDSILGSSDDLQKRCGTRSFKETALPNNQAAMGEFPWACSVFTRGRNEKYVGGCVIVPNTRDNSVNQPTYKIVTAASKLAKVGKSEQLKVRIRYINLNDGNFEDDYNVAHFISHPKFDKVKKI